MVAVKTLLCSGLCMIFPFQFMIFGNKGRMIFGFLFKTYSFVRVKEKENVQETIFVLL